MVKPNFHNRIVPLTHGVLHQNLLWTLCVKRTCKFTLEMATSEIPQKVCKDNQECHIIPVELSRRYTAGSYIWATEQFTTRLHWLNHGNKRIFVKLLFYMPNSIPQSIYKELEIPPNTVTIKCWCNPKIIIFMILFDINHRTVQKQEKEPEFRLTWKSLIVIHE